MLRACCFASWNTWSHSPGNGTSHAPPPRASVSQPSLSAGIRKLEGDLGVPIVQHGARFEGLTPEGERVLHRARRILHERDRSIRNWPRCGGS